MTSEAEQEYLIVATEMVLPPYKDPAMVTIGVKQDGSVYWGIDSDYDGVTDPGKAFGPFDLDDSANLPEVPDQIESIARLMLESLRAPIPF